MDKNIYFDCGEEKVLLWDYDRKTNSDTIKKVFRLGERLSKALSADLTITFTDFDRAEYFVYDDSIHLYVECDVVYHIALNKNTDTSVIRNLLSGERYDISQDKRSIIIRMPFLLNPYAFRIGRQDFHNIVKRDINRTYGKLTGRLRTIDFFNRDYTIRSGKLGV